MAKAETDSAKVTSIDSITVSAAVLGDLFGVTDRRIRQMAEEGIVARAAKGRYKLVESVKNYLLTLKLAAEGVGVELADGEINFEEEKALHERIKRHISELKLQIMKGELHKAEDVEIVSGAWRCPVAPSTYLTYLVILSSASCVVFFH